MADLDRKRDELYEQCLTFASESTGPNHDVFNQSDLMATGITSDLMELMQICQKLISVNQFQVLQLDGQVCWRCRSREDAARMSLMNEKELMVYTTIEASTTTGIWTKTLSARTNLHQSVLTKALKYLETKGYVKQIKSVKFPKRKMYMLKDLEPTEETSGGPWFSDGELDVEFISSIANIMEIRIKRQSWRDGKKLVLKPQGEEADDVLEELETDFTRDRRFYAPSMNDKKRNDVVPYPAGHKGYPTATELLNWIEAQGLVTGKDIQLQDMNALLDVLVYDGKIERMGKRKVDAAYSASSSSGAKKREAEVLGSDDDDEEATSSKKPKKGRAKHQSPPPEPQEEDMFRWVRRPLDEDIENGPGNGFSEAPCSRCPVFRLCEDGGPVDARSCEYFEKWLDPGS